MLLEERPSRGLRSPRTPTAGPSALHPFCDRDVLSTNVFPHVTWRTGTRAHGRYENEKRAAERMHSLTASFYRFPRMHSIRPAVFHTAQPVARSAGNQFANAQSSFVKGFLRAAVPHPICKVSTFLCKSVCACCSAHREIV